MKTSYKKAARRLNVTVVACNVTSGSGIVPHRCGIFRGARRVRKRSSSQASAVKVREKQRVGRKEARLKAARVMRVPTTTS